VKTRTALARPHRPCRQILRSWLWWEYGREPPGIRAAQRRLHTSRRRARSRNGRERRATRRKRRKARRLRRWPHHSHPHESLDVIRTNL